MASDEVATARSSVAAPTRLAWVFSEELRDGIGTREKDNRGQTTIKGSFA